MLGGQGSSASSGTLDKDRLPRSIRILVRFVDLIRKPLGCWVYKHSPWLYQVPYPVPRPNAHFLVSISFSECISLNSHLFLRNVPEIEMKKCFYPESILQE